MGKVGGNMVKANSPLGLMAMKGKTGEELRVEVDTDDHSQGQAIIDQIQQYLKG